jgi:hypothetical protein
LLCHPDILAHYTDIRERTICALSDNTAALSRARKGSATFTGPPAYLCRLGSLHQRTHRYRLRADYLPGPLNVMSDDLSRLWDLSDTEIALHFSRLYPQAQPWVHCHLRPEMSSAVILALSSKRCDPASLLDAKSLPPLTGNAGAHSVNNMAWTPSSVKVPMQLPGSKYSLAEYETAGFPPPVTLSELERWRMPLARSHRPTNWMADPTLAASQAPPA